MTKKVLRLTMRPRIHVRAITATACGISKLWMTKLSFPHLGTST